MKTVTAPPDSTIPRPPWPVKDFDADLEKVLMEI
jgi:hypothetical protein